MFWKSNYLLTGVFVHTRGEITFSSLDLHQIFVHPRTAFEESDKVVKPEFRFMPSPSSSPRAPGNQTRWRILAPSKRIFKIRSTTLKRGSRATGKPGFYFVQSKHVGCISPRVCESNSLSKQSDFPKGWFLNNYVTPVLITTFYDEYINIDIFKS